jgi:hypothetical protein
MYERAAVTDVRERRGRERGQLVLAAAVVVVVALLPVLLAYLQLGAHPDVRPAPAEPSVDVASGLERATVAVGTDVSGRYDWGERAAAATAVRRGLAPDLSALGSARAGSGTVLGITYAGDVAARASRVHCPAGSGRAFGPCVADGGVVVQERAGEAVPVAVAYEVLVVGERGERRLTFLVRVADGSRLSGSVRATR